MARHYAERDQIRIAIWGNLGLALVLVSLFVVRVDREFGFLRWKLVEQPFGNPSAIEAKFYADLPVKLLPQAAISVGLQVVALGWLLALLMRKARKRGECQKCGYSLRGLTIRRCPECGTHFWW